MTKYSIQLLTLLFSISLLLIACSGPRMQLYGGPKQAEEAVAYIDFCNVNIDGKYIPYDPRTMCGGAEVLPGMHTVVILWKKTRTVTAFLSKPGKQSFFASSMRDLSCEIMFHSDAGKSYGVRSDYKRKKIDQSDFKDSIYQYTSFSASIYEKGTNTIVGHCSVNPDDIFIME
jgi:hypothetical protein